LRYLRTVEEETTKHAVDEEEAQEDEEQDMQEEEEEEEDELMREFQQRAAPRVTSSELEKSQLCTRRIIAEDPSWSLAIVPSLSDICIHHIAENFCC